MPETVAEQSNNPLTANQFRRREEMVTHLFGVLHPLHRFLTSLNRLMDGSLPGVVDRASLWGTNLDPV